MALVSQKYNVSVTMLDNGGNSTTRTYESTGTTQAEAEAGALALIAALNAISDCLITNYAVNHVFGSDVALALPTSGVQIENQLELTVELTGVGSKKATLNVPSPVITAFQAVNGSGANQANLAATPVVNFVNLFKTSALTSGFKLSDGEFVDVAIKGQRIHRKSRNG